MLADQLFQKLQQLESFKKSKNVSIYISMPTCEIMTKNIILHLLNSGKCLKKGFFFTLGLRILFKTNIALYLVVRKIRWIWLESLVSVILSHFL